MATRSPHSTRRSPTGSGSRALRRTASGLALLAGALGVASMATPALADCVEGLPGQYSCSGATDVPQIIVGDDVTATALPGFSVDTSANGNGVALQMTGDGRIAYVDLQASPLTGGGVRFSSTGSSGADAGSVVVVSGGAIVADGANGLRLDNAGGGDILASWAGPIVNTGGNGVHVRTEFGSGDASLQTGSVQGRDDGVWFQFGGNGSLAFTGLGPIGGDTGAGLRINAGAAADDINVTVGEVTGGTFGIVIDSDGTDAISVTSTGTVSGLGDAGIAVQGGVNTTGIEVVAGEVNGQTAGIRAANYGTGGTSIVASGTVAGATSFGIVGYNDVTATDLSITAVDVIGNLGIIADNTGTGATTVVSTGHVFGFTVDAIRVTAGVNTDDLLVDVNDVTGAQTAISIVNFGAGLTTVRSSGTVTGEDFHGIDIEAGTGSTGVRVEVADVDGDAAGIFIVNNGTGATTVASTGRISAFASNGVSVFGAADIRIDVVDVIGGGQVTADGVFALSQGTGDVYITATGTVTGSTYGVRAETTATAGEVVVDVNNVSGGASGVSAGGFGSGPVEITTRGLVHGGDQGIEAFSDIQGVVIVNEGVVRNSSGLSSDRAIQATGAFVTVDNQGSLVGGMDLFADATLVTNAGVWSNVGGSSSFGGGDDALFNMANGTIFGGAVSGLTETTSWSGLEAFTNRGLVQLTDGGAGDRIVTSGYAVFEDTSRLAVDIAGAGVSDSFRATGTVEIEPGARLTVNRVQPLVLHSQYVVVQATGGLTGQFDFDDQMLTAFAGLRDGYTATTAYVEFAQLRALADAAMTPNQEATAEGADSLPDGNAVKDALLLLPDDATAQAAFDQLSGEIHPAARTAVAEDSGLARRAVLDRLADSDVERSGWARVFGLSGRNDGDANAAELERETRGFLLGVDRRFGEVTVGVAGGWLTTDLDIDARDSTGTVESIHVLAYAGTRIGAWGLRGGVGYAATSAETRRTITFPGFAAVTTADYDGSVLQGFIEAGYRLSAGEGQIEPFLNLTAVSVESDAFEEAGGPAALSGRSAGEQTVVSTVGLRFQTGPLSGPLSLRGAVGWRHVSGDLDPVGVHAFSGGDPFRIIGAAQSGDAFTVGGEARWRVSEGVSVGVAYDGALGSDGEDHAITGSLRVLF